MPQHKTKQKRLVALVDAYKTKFQKQAVTMREVSAWARREGLIPVPSIRSSRAEIEAWEIRLAEATAKDHLEPASAQTNVPTARAGKYHIRWMIRRDLEFVCSIEKTSFEFPWMMDDFIRCLRQRNAIGMVVELGSGEIAGYMIYELHKNRLHLLNFAVAEHLCRQGAGRQMFSKLTSKLSRGRRTMILLEIRESNLDAQLFFQAMGCRAISVLRNYYDDTDEDAYLLQYRLPLANELTNAR